MPNAADVEILIKARDEASKVVDRAMQKIKVSTKGTSASLQNYDKAVRDADVASRRLSRAVSGQPKQFAGWALSIMFFGMAIKNTMNSIWQSSSKTFNDVMHSVEGTTTGFDLLADSLTYLGFTIGSALEPIAMFLAPIIEAIANWVADNETLAATLLVVAAVIGTILFTIGFLVLAINGIASAWTIVAGLWATWGAAATAAGTTIGAAFGAILIWFVVIAAAIALLVILWKSDFGKIQGFFIETFGILWNTVKSIFGNIINIFSGIWKVLKGVFTGDFEMIWQGLVVIVKNVIALLLKLFYGLGAAIANVFVFAVNLVIATVMNLATTVLGFIKKVIELSNKYLGTDFSLTGINMAMDQLKSIKEAAHLDYISGDTVSNGLAGIDALMGIGTDTSAPAPAAPAPSTVVNNNTFNVTQQPGETGDAFAQRLLLLLQQNGGG